jgi:hypothetical protein
MSSDRKPAASKSRVLERLACALEVAKPLGSLSPGVMSFASTPEINPIKIVHKIPIPSLLLNERARCARLSQCL